MAKNDTRVFVRKDLYEYIASLQSVYGGTTIGETLTLILEEHRVHNRSKTATPVTAATNPAPITPRKSFKMLK